MAARQLAVLCLLLVVAWVVAGPAMAAAEAVNAPPAAASLLLLGSAARVDRAADSAGAVRLTLEGVSPAAASLPPNGSSAGIPAPLIQAAGPALAAVPPGAPVTLILTTADGAQRSLVARATAPPQWLADDGGRGHTVAVEAELVGPAGVSLGRGAAASLVSTPGALRATNLPSRLESAVGAGAALMIDVKIV